MADHGVAGFPGGFEAGRDPGAAVEQVAEGVEFADSPFRGGGYVGLDKGELGEPGEGAPAAAGAALLDLERPYGPLGFYATACSRLTDPDGYATASAVS